MTEQRFEFPAEMEWIAGAGVIGDHAQGVIGDRQTPTGFRQTQMFDVINGRTADLMFEVRVKSGRRKKHATGRTVIYKMG